MVTNAMKTENKPATANTHHSIFILYAKSFIHLFITHHATGDATRMEINTSFRKSLDNIITILLTEAPTTFLIPISFVLCNSN